VKIHHILRNDLQTPRIHPPSIKHSNHPTMPSHFGLNFLRQRNIVTENKVLYGGNASGYLVYFVIFSLFSVAE